MSKLRIGIVICSSADLPSDIIIDNDINVLPINLKLKNSTFVDNRDPVMTQEFYNQYLKNKNLQVTSEPFSSDKITQWFLDELVLKYDRILLLTLASSRSTLHENVTQASFKILTQYKERRRAAGIKGSFSFRVLDTKNLFTGEAVIAHEVIRLLKEDKISFDKLRPHIEELTKFTYGFLVPNDLYYLRNVGRRKGDKSVSAMKYVLGKTLDIKPIVTCNNGDSYSIDKVKGFDNAVNYQFTKAKEAIALGLLIPVVCMSYAGNINDITERHDYKEFVTYAEKYNIKTTITVMSTTAGVNMGPGAFSIGYASKYLNKIAKAA